MRKLFFLGLFVAGGQLAHAQTTFKAGTALLGGSVNYSHNGEEYKSTYGNTTYTTTYSANSFTLAPYFGFFAADNLAVGLNLSYTSQNSYTTSTPSNNTTVNDRATTSLRIGAFGQYYRMLTEQFGLTGTLGAGYENDFRPSRYSGQTTPGPDLRATGFYTTLTPGLIFLPIPRLGIGASVGSLSYLRLNVTQEGNTSNTTVTTSDVATTFGASFGLDQLTFSGTYFFGR